jgi:hypothetical protein
LSCPPKPRDAVGQVNRGGRPRQAQVVAVDGSQFEATYPLKSGQWRSAWFDGTALQPGTGPS